VAWCDCFVDWCFVQAYGKAAALALTCQPTKAANNCGAGCKYSRQYYQNKKQLHDSPQPGDQVFFYNSSKSSIAHTGLVYDVDGTYVYTVEGNTSSASGVVANGGAVAKKKYKLTNSRLAGYGRPNYGAQEAGNASQSSPTKPVIKYPTYTVQRGDSLWTIAREQLGKGTRYREIMTLNGLKSDLIKAGEVIKLPVK
jgi:LysM repeat protein